MLERNAGNTITSTISRREGGRGWKRGKNTNFSSVASQTPMPGSNVSLRLGKRISKNNRLELKEVERPRKKLWTRNINKYEKPVHIQKCCKHSEDYCPLNKFKF